MLIDKVFASEYNCVGMFPDEVVRLIVAGLGGAAVGVERQWSGKAEGPAARFAGVRTFTLLGGLAGGAGWISTQGATWLAALLLAGAVAITVAAYIAGSRFDVDGTTEVAALVVLVAGVLAGLGSIRTASGIIAVTILLLVEKSRLHAAVRRIDDLELRAGVRFAVMALVVLPLLPAGPFGPYEAVRPREIWLLVLFFSGLSFVGHVMRRAAGPERGYILSGLAGGLLSSTNVTLTFARTSHTEPAVERALAYGTVAANTVLYGRVLAATAVLDPSLVPELSRYLAAPALVGILAALTGFRSRPVQSHAPGAALAQSPLQLGAALQMAGIFVVVMILVNVARDTWGQAGVLTTAAVLGLTDVDALTLSMTREVAPTSPAIAALAIAIGVAANTTLKTIIAVTLGAPRFRRIVGSTLLLMIAASLAAIYFHV